jgi:hypothetical protein
MHLLSLTKYFSNSPLCKKAAAKLMYNRCSHFFHGHCSHKDDEAQPLTLSCRLTSAPAPISVCTVAV